MNSFDYVNDVHLDFWVPNDNNPTKYKEKTIDFSRKIIPEKPSSVLVIGGDLGHYNLQNYWFLESLSSIYNHILLVVGNHDYYLVSGNQEKKYHSNSFHRVNEMKELAENLNVHYLEGDIVNIDGIHFGGTGMWYDFSFGTQIQNKTYDQVYLEWSNNSNDAKLIKKLLKKEHFQQEKERLESIIEGSDVLITHMGPQWRFSPYKNEQERHNSYYFFDGTAYTEKVKNKIWCFGHIHSVVDEIHDECRYISYALGYPDEFVLKKIKQIHIKQN